jgi:hypothetical protein
MINPGLPALHARETPSPERTAASPPTDHFPPTEQVEPVVDPPSPLDVTPGVMGFSAEFSVVLAKHQNPRRALRQVGREMSDDAKHTPTLVAGILVCFLAVWTTALLYLAIGQGLTPSDDKAPRNAGEPPRPRGGLQIAVVDEAVVDESVSTQAGRAALSLYSYALPRVTVVQDLVDTALMQVGSTRTIDVVTVGHAPAILESSTEQAPVTEARWTGQATPAAILLPPRSGDQGSAISATVDQPADQPALLVPPSRSWQPEDKQTGATAAATNNQGRRDKTWLTSISVATQSPARNITTASLDASDITSTTATDISTSSRGVDDTESAPDEAPPAQERQTEGETASGAKANQAGRLSSELSGPDMLSTDNRKGRGAQKNESGEDTNSSGAPSNNSSPETKRASQSDFNEGMKASGDRGFSESKSFRDTERSSLAGNSRGGKSSDKPAKNGPEGKKSSKDGAKSSAGGSSDSASRGSGKSGKGSGSGGEGHGAGGKDRAGGAGKDGKAH